MSIQLSVPQLVFAQKDEILTYSLKVLPAIDSVKITVEGNFEIALGNNSTPHFGRELILLPDTTHVPYKIERTIIVRFVGKGAENGRIIHASPISPEQLSLPLACTQADPSIAAAPKKDTPPPVSPSFQFNRTDIKFKNQPIDTAKIESVTLQTQHVEKYTLSTEVPYALSLDGKAFLQEISITPNLKDLKQQFYVRFLPTKEGTYPKSIVLKADHGAARQIRVFGECKMTKPLHIPPALGIWLRRLAAPLLIIGILSLLANWWTTRKKDSPSTAQEVAEVTPPPSVPKPTPALLTTAAKNNDPACKPSLYQKLKEKTTTIRYGCVNPECDTTYVRNILTHASGSKAFQYINIHKKGEMHTECGVWIEQVFKDDLADILYSDKECVLGNVDKSHSLCSDNDTQGRCVFLLPCGNSEGMLKVLNREIRNRKSKMNILE